MPLTLDMARPGSRVRVVGFQSSGGWVYRLYQMGILPGSVLEVVANYGAGPLVVRVMGAEVAIGRGVARRILVENAG